MSTTYHLSFRVTADQLGPLLTKIGSHIENIQVQEVRPNGGRQTAPAKQPRRVRRLSPCHDAALVFIRGVKIGQTCTEKALGEYLKSKGSAASSASPILTKLAREQLVLRLGKRKFRVLQHPPEPVLL